MAWGWQSLNFSLPLAPMQSPGEVYEDEAPGSSDNFIFKTASSDTHCILSLGKILLE